MPNYYTLSEGDMKELEELRVGSMGVVRKDTATAMSDTSKILVVGLGGMGLATVWSLKKALLDRIGKLRPEDIRFISVDTDKNDLQKKVDTGILAESETHCLHNDNMGAVMKLDKSLRPPAIRSIWPSDTSGFNPQLDGQGANQVRLAGRISLMDNSAYDALVTKLRAAISGLQDFTRKKLEIHVVAGIGGGTGSGLCVDVPYIIRKVASALNVPEDNMRIFGHVFLPNVYEGTPGCNLDQAYHNGYAALKEIDYYMNIEEVGETFDVVYPDGEYSSGKNIFNFCTLIGGKISSAMVISNPKQAAVNTCVENLVNQVTRVVISKTQLNEMSQKSMADMFTSDSFRNNIKAALDVVMSNNTCNFHESGNYKYTCVGASAVKFPTESIIEYFMGEVYGKMQSQMEHNAALLKQGDVDAYEKGIIKPTELVDELLVKFDSAAVNKLADFSWKKDTIGSPEVEVEMGKLVSDFVKEFDKNSDLVSRACAKASQKAADIFQDPAKGPYYLSRLLTADSRQGDSVRGYFETLNNYVTVCSNRVDTLKTEQGQHRKQLEELAEKLQKSLFGLNKNTLQSYQDTVVAMWKDELAMKLYQKLGDEYFLDSGKATGACYQIRSQLERKYLAYVDIFTKIGSIMADNAQASKAAIFKDDIPGSIFGLTDQVFDVLKDTVRHGVNTKLKNFDEKDIANFAAALLNNMITKPEAWMLDINRPFGESVCAEALRNVIYNYKAFEDITQKTFVKYFDEAYRTETPARKDTIVMRIVEHLNANAAPMFNVFPTFAWASANVLCHRFMIIPNNMGDAWGDLFDRHLGTNNKNILVSPDQNAIYNYVMYAALPIWLHADLIEYEKKYYAITTAGVHINENPELDPPYAQYPALMAPQQWYRAKVGANEYTNDRETKVREEIADLIDRAKAMGIIARSGAQNNFVVELLKNHPNDAELDRFFRQYEADRKNYDQDELKGGANLWNALKEQFGGVVATIHPARSLNASQEDSLPELIRKQMMLVGKLKKELAFAEAKIQSRIDERNKDLVQKKARKDATVFMLYGLIDADSRGMWSYHLGENTFNIIAKLQVAVSSDMAHFANYMEYVVSKKFYELEQAPAHINLLKKKVQNMNLAIFDNPTILETINDNYTKFSAKATQVIDTLSAKVDNGLELSNDEVELLEFYQQMQKDMLGIKSAFSAD